MVVLTCLLSISNETMIASAIALFAIPWQRAPKTSLARSECPIIFWLVSLPVANGDQEHEKVAVAPLAD